MVKMGKNHEKPLGMNSRISWAAKTQFGEIHPERIIKRPSLIKFISDIYIHLYPHIIDGPIPIF